MDMDFATSCPLVRPALPRIRFLFVGSRFCSTLPSDGSSRFRPCASLVLHLHQVAQGTFTPRLLDMPSTQEAAGCARRDALDKQLEARGLCFAYVRSRSGGLDSIWRPCWPPRDHQ